MADVVVSFSLGVHHFVYLRECIFPLLRCVAMWVINKVVMTLKNILLTAKKIAPRNSGHIATEVDFQ